MPSTNLFKQKSAGCSGPVRDIWGKAVHPSKVHFRMTCIHTCGHMAQMRVSSQLSSTPHTAGLRPLRKAWPQKLMLDSQGLQFEAGLAASIHDSEAGLIVAWLAQPCQKVPPEARTKDSHPKLLGVKRHPVSVPAAAAAAAVAVAVVAALCGCPLGKVSLSAHWKDQDESVVLSFPKHGSLAADSELLAFGSGFGFVKHPAAAGSAAFGELKHEPNDCPQNADFCCQDHLHVTSARKPSPCVRGAEDALRRRSKDVPQLGKHAQWTDATEEKMRPCRHLEILC
mmetsp:Transcript_65893/g.129886  ORF Transcript_65893/g.129886 Transcript_65893/m.129886 type:complete len:283 (-) Transcript_65893:1011-1859(-)